MGKETKKVGRVFSKRTNNLVNLIIESSKDSSWTFSFKKWETKAGSYLKFFQLLQGYNKKEFNRNFRFDGELLDLILIQHLVLYQILFPYSDIRNKKLVTLKKKNVQFLAISTMTLLMVNAINSLCSVKLLAQCGLHYQARVLFRNYIETMDISIALLVDENFLLDYTKEVKNEKEEKERWRKTRPFIIQNIIKSFFEKNEKYGESFGPLLQIRNEYYSVSSSFTHSSFEFILLNSYPELLNGEKVRISGIGGYVNSSTQGLLKATYEYSSVAVNLMQFLLHDKYSLALSDKKSNERFYNAMKNINVLTWMYLRYVQEHPVDTESS